MCAHAEPCITFMVPGSSKTRDGGGVEAGVRGSPSIRRQISTAPWWKGHACRNNARTAAPTERNTALNNKFFVSILLNESRFPSIVGFYQQARCDPSKKSRGNQACIQSAIRSPSSTLAMQVRFNAPLFASKIYPQSCQPVFSHAAPKAWRRLFRSRPSRKISSRRLPRLIR